MKISLRKANALQSLIQEGLGENVTPLVTINKFENPSAVVASAAKEFLLGVSKKFALVDVLFSIRKKVGHANAEVGIDALLTDLALLEKQSYILKGLASTTTFAAPIEQVQAALDELKTQKQDGIYGRRESINVSIVSRGLVDQYKSSVNTLRKQKQELSDKLLHLNVSTEIELSEEEEAVLKQYEIL